MNLECLSIGQMARLNHISEQTLRLYDRMNLFTPIGVNPDNGYRYYAISQSAKLDLIRYYQKLGFPLKDIRDILMNPDNDSVAGLLSDKYEQLSKEIDALKECKKALLRTLNNFSYYNSLPQNSLCFCEHLPPKNIIVYDAKENLYEYDYNQYEYNLRRFRNYLEEHGYDPHAFESIGFIIRTGNPSGAHLNSTEFFVTTDCSADNFPNAEKIPEGTYLSSCFSDFDKKTAYTNLLLREASKSGMQITGDIYCETLPASLPASKKEQALRYKIMVRIA